MKKLLTTLLSSALLLNTAFAGDAAQLRIHVADPIKENKYFLCIYNVGCLSIRAAADGKIFPLQPMNLGNVTKFVVTDVTTMRIYEQEAPKSCDAHVTDNQKVTISGDLVIRNNVPHINNLSCSIT